jgi:hypothetical protein
MGSYNRTVHKHDVNSIRITGLPTCVIGNFVVRISDINYTVGMTVAILYKMRLSCGLDLSCTERFNIASEESQ